MSDLLPANQMPFSKESHTPLFGYRNEMFQSFLFKLLKRSGLKDKYVHYLTGKDCIDLYSDAFTHISIHSEKNYEYLEILGDATCNKSIVWYIKERFPHLRNSEGVKVIARLRINLVSKKNFSQLAEKLGFLPFISCDKEVRDQKGKSLLEDVFEAFFGATELLLDQLLGIGTGYCICYRLMKSFLNDMNISLKYEDLYDAITRLKETFDYYRQQLPGRQCPLIWGNMIWENVKTMDGNQTVHLYQYDKCSNRKKLLASASASFLDEAKQSAASVFLRYLANEGYKRPIPSYYDKILME